MKTINIEVDMDFCKHLKEFAPVILDFYSAGGVHTVNWINPEYSGNYLFEYPKVLVDRANAQGGNFPARFILVSESENACRKAAMYLAWKKLDARYQYAVEHNLPIDGKFEDLVQAPEILQMDLETQEKTAFEANMNVVAGVLTQLDSVFYTGFSKDNLHEEFIRYMMYENKFNSFIAVSPKVFQEPQIQRLVYEQTYDVIFLPKEPEDYYEKVAEVLFFMPAGNAYAQLVAEEERYKEFEPFLHEFAEKIPYVPMLGYENVRGAVRKLKALRGRYFKEADIAILFNAAFEKECNLYEVLQAERQRDLDDLNAMKGFGQIRGLVKKQMAMCHAKRRNSKLKEFGGNYLFYGRPGTGKTEGAKLLYEVLSSTGCVSGRFVVASRKEIIGAYVGQTAPKVADLFDQAANGILFIDEAGFFLQTGTGGYVKEAIKEFVRFMETRRDVCVIFAVYPEEKERFLDLDKGLTSRISQIVPFEDYTEEQLLDIADFMWKEQGYQVRKEGRKILAEYLAKKKQLSKDNFGNAREARRLVELSIQEAELRLLETKKQPVKKGLVTVTTADLQKAMETCLEGAKEQKEAIGFRIEKKDEKVKLPVRLPLLYEMA